MLMLRRRTWLFVVGSIRDRSLARNKMNCKLQAGVSGCSIAHQPELVSVKVANRYE